MVNREKTNFVWNGQNLAAENKANSVNTYTYDMTGVHIANQNGNVISYLKDYHGNVVGRTTAAGALVENLTIEWTMMRLAIGGLATPRPIWLLRRILRQRKRFDLSS